MTKFRKKPIVIEARRYTRRNRASIGAWCGASMQGVDEDGCPYELLNIRINTLEGSMAANPGDWIIKGVAGEFYPCKNVIFLETYEAVEDVPDVPDREEA